MVAIKNFPLLVQLLEQFFLRLNGKRAMTGNLDLSDYKLLFANTLIKQYGATETLYFMNLAETDFANVGCKSFNSTGASQILGGLKTPIIIPIAEGNDMVIRSGTGAFGLAKVEFKSGANSDVCAVLEKGFWRIPLAGDIILLDDKFIDLGDAVSGLPTANATNRGKMGIVEGGEGVADQVCICVKKVDDSYGWFDVISGGFV